MQRRSFLTGITASSIAIPWMLHQEELCADDIVKPDFDSTHVWS